MSASVFRDPGANFTDDSAIGIARRTNGRTNAVLHRSSSEQAFCTLPHMEKNYCKLGDGGLRQHDLIKNGRIRVSSLNRINVFDESSGYDSDTVFAGRRDVSDPNSMTEREIVSARGTVRGFKNRVRAGIATFLEQQNGYTDCDDEHAKRNYRHLEKGKVIVYTTSMTVVRSTSDRCKAVRNLLQTHMVRYEERDMFMSKENQKELADRIGDCAILPQVFANGVHIGNYNDLQQMNEVGELRPLFQTFTKIQVRSSCDKCGGYRYLPCTSCHGSKKSLHRNDFTEEFCALRCMQCDENGLVRCDECIDQQE